MPDKQPEEVQEAQKCQPYQIKTNCQTKSIARRTKRKNRRDG